MATSLTSRSIKLIQQALAAVALGTATVSITGCKMLESSTGAPCATCASNAPHGPALNMITYFDKAVTMAPDHTKNYEPHPCLLGRVYLQGKDGNPLCSDGTMSVTLFDERPMNGGPPVALEQWNIDKGELKKMIARDRVGWGYTLALPTVTCRPHVMQVRMDVVFKPDQSTDQLFASSKTVRLDYAAIYPNMPAMMAGNNRIGQTPLAGQPSGTTGLTGWAPNIPQGVMSAKFQAAGTQITPALPQQYPVNYPMAGMQQPMPQMGQPMQPMGPMQTMAQPMQQMGPMQTMAPPMQQMGPMQTMGQPMQQMGQLPMMAQPIQQMGPIPTMAQPMQPMGQTPTLPQPMQPAGPAPTMAQPMQQVAPFPVVAQPMQTVVPMTTAAQPAPPVPQQTPPPPVAVSTTPTQAMPYIPQSGQGAVAPAMLPTSLPPANVPVTMPRLPD